MFASAGGLRCLHLLGVQGCLHLLGGLRVFASAGGPRVFGSPHPREEQHYKGIKEEPLLYVTIKEWPLLCNY